MAASIDLHERAFDGHHGARLHLHHRAGLDLRVRIRLHRDLRRLDRDLGRLDLDAAAADLQLDRRIRLDDDLVPDLDALVVVDLARLVVLDRRGQ
ncbi:conserved hypothetical protein, partial [Ricinus communis]